MKKIKFALMFILLLCTLQQIWAQDKKISFDFQNEPMPSALRKIAQTYNQKISFSHEDISLYKANASVHAKDVQDALRQTLVGTPLLFKEKGEFITVFLDPTSTEAIKRKNLCVITGSVHDELGDPLPGATVTITHESQQWGGSTDIDGNFTVYAPRPIIEKEKCFIQASFIGFKKERFGYKSPKAEHQVSAANFIQRNQRSGNHRIR